MQAIEFIPNNANRTIFAFASFYSLSAILLGIYHCVSGSNPILALVFVLISIIGAIFISLPRATFTNIFIFLLSVYSGYSALIAKAILNQKLQQNLFAPTDSALYLLIGFISIAICGLLAKSFIGQRSAKIGKKIESEQFLRSALIPLLVIGFATRIMHSILSVSVSEGGQEVFGFGGFGTFNFVLLLACVILLRLYSWHRTSTLGIIIMGLMALLVALAVVTNTKKAILDFAILCIICIYAFGIPVKFRIVAVSGVLLVIIVAFISPAIHIMRSDFRSLSMAERIGGVYELLRDNNFDPSRLATAEASFLRGFSYSYNSAGSYVYPSSANIDRFFLVLPIDQVARNLDRIGTIGINPFIDELAEAVLPSLLIKKDPETGPDIVAWKYGIRAPTSTARPVIGFTASALAASGVVGVIFLPILVIFPFLLFMEYFFGQVFGRVWGVFGVVIAYQLVEKEIDQILPFVFRTGPVIFITLSICLFLSSHSIRWRTLL